MSKFERKTSGFRTRWLFPIFLLCFVYGTEVRSGDMVKFSQGVLLYNSGQYSKALPLLETAVRSSPYNSSAHYYLALCYQALKQSSLAQQHFQWVASNPQNPTLQSYAAKALQSSSGLVSSAGRTSTSMVAAVPAPQVGGTPVTVGKPNNYGRCKVFLVETSWCHYCHEFAPRFEQAASKYASFIDFQHIDAEDPSNAEFIEKYGIKSYPRLVYLDGKGNLLYNEGRGNFENRLQELTGK